MPALIPRPTFRIDLKVLVRRANGSNEIVHMPYPGVFSGRTIDAALADAAEAACEEARRVSKRPTYDLLGLIGQDFHLLNLSFIRVDVENEDDDALNPKGNGRPGA